MTEIEITEDQYIVLLKYFQGDVIYLDKNVLKDLKNGKFNGEDVKPVDKEILRKFNKILAFKEKKPEKYAKKKWGYPNWTESDKLKKLKEAFPEDYSDESDLPSISTLGPIYSPGSDHLHSSYQEKLEKEEKSLPEIKVPKEGPWGEFTFDEQVEILVEFYSKYDPEKTYDEVYGIVNRRRNKGTPKGTAIPDKPWRKLCERLGEKYGVNPLYFFKDKEESYKPETPRDPPPFFEGEDPRKKESLKEIVELKDKKNILPQRKAFVDWVNNIFYKEQVDNLDSDELNIYQYFVKQYLAIETPFRGLLVYHGLGTGKSATSVITAEGLSKSLPIYTMLPASLETEYIKEVKRWGDELFKIDQNNWVLFPLKQIEEDIQLRRKLSKKYGIDVQTIKSLFNQTKNKLKNNLKESSDYDEKIGELMKQLESVKGIFLQSDLKNDQKIYTTTGEPLLKDDEEFSGDCEKLTEIQRKFIDEEINFLVESKYNFIHYNPFPAVTGSEFKEFNVQEFNEEQKEYKTKNQKLVKSLSEKYKYNVENNSTYSPFHEEVIIVDEVHNFVREVINESAPAMVFYNWIVNAEDIKIVFLSGTPVINRPAEIAILYNMLRGSISVYEFTVKTDISEEQLQDELRKQFYTSNSSIEQLHVSKQGGKTVISFIKNKTNFESILDSDNIVKTVKYNNHTFEEFIDEIYKGLERFKEITPSKKDFDNLSSQEIKDIKLGKPKIFDQELNLIFNRRQKLFDIHENGNIIDLTDNSKFMEYFFDESYNVYPKKKVLLRRMLMGLTSYYPIDRSSIVNMPEIVEAPILPIYEDYKIAKNINLVQCYMSSVQWNKYHEVYTDEKQKDLRRNIYDDDKWHYRIRTRQNCNIVYDDDSFRKRGSDSSLKHKAYDSMLQNGNLEYDKNLKLYSPKFYNILTNIQKFIENDLPSGKILYYSDFVQDAGSEIFEKILIANGYEKYNSEKQNINELIDKNLKKKRFTFITGDQSKDQKRINKESYNHRENIYGEFIQIMLISSSGAEGISLTGVRQVHIMEPFWNFIRIDQVFGRAIRMKSHIGSDRDKDGNLLPPLLPEDKRNVEQYLYLSFLPEGETVEEIFTSLKELEWEEVKDIDDGQDVKLRLVNDHQGVYKTIQKILSMKKETLNRTGDQLLFDTMEKKHKISLTITDIIKEASVDCIQNTRDDVQLNERCLRFSDKISSEEAHFPGIGSERLNELDKRQFEANFKYIIKPDIYVISALKDGEKIFIYYRIKDADENTDVRYIRENGKYVCEYNENTNLFNYYEEKDHFLNKQLGSKLSVFQTIYKTTEFMKENQINNDIFPELDDIVNSENILGNIIKYNVDERLFYSPKTESKIITLYEYEKYKENNRSTRFLKPIYVRNKKIFIKSD